MGQAIRGQLKSLAVKMDTNDADKVAFEKGLFARALGTPRTNFLPDDEMRAALSAVSSPLGFLNPTLQRVSRAPGCWGNRAQSWLTAAGSSID